jgi:hypothetical protein
VTPAGGDGLSPEPLVVVEPSDVPASAAPAPIVPRDEKGHPKKGYSLNPKGRPRGIPNRNTELVKLVNSRELSWCWKRAKELAKKGDLELLKFLLGKTLIDQSPAAAGITINANSSANAGAEAASAPMNLHDRLAQLTADPAAVDEVAHLAARLAARGAHSVGAGKNGN